MKISEMITALQRVKKGHGDVEVVWIYNSQFADIESVHALTNEGCPQSLRWCMSGTVALITLDKN